MCAATPISSFPEFNTKFVSESNVIIYFIFGNNFFAFSSSSVFALNGFCVFPSKYSFNWVINPLFLSQPKKQFSVSFHVLFLYINWNFPIPFIWIFFVKFFYFFFSLFYYLFIDFFFFFFR